MYKVMKVKTVGELKAVLPDNDNAVVEFWNAAEIMREEVYAVWHDVQEDGDNTVTLALRPKKTQEKF